MAVYQDSPDDTQLGDDFYSTFPLSSDPNGRWLSEDFTDLGDLERGEHGAAPLLSNQPRNGALKISFTDNSLILSSWHLRQQKVSRGVVNGYIKMHVGSGTPERAGQPAKRHAVSLGNQPYGVHHRQRPGVAQAHQRVHPIPPDFGREYKLDKIDGVLLAFCKHPPEGLGALFPSRSPRRDA